jgi:transcription elongation GreA/GreB family factor
MAPATEPRLSPEEPFFQLKNRPTSCEKIESHDADISLSEHPEYRTTFLLDELRGSEYMYLDEQEHV